MPHDVFISFRDTVPDKAEAEKVCGHLEAQGISCWFAPRDSVRGERYPRQIVRAIHDCRVLVLIFSGAANGSEHIANEVDLAFGKKSILPIRIEDVSFSDDLEYYLRAAHRLDAIGGIREEHLQRLTVDLRKHLGTAGARAATQVAESPERPASKPVAPPVAETEPSPAKPGAEEKLRTRVHPVDGLTYVYIPPGKFMMGCSPGDSECRDNEKPPHEEEIADGFWLCQAPVTQAAWAKVKGGNPSHFKGDQLPVEQVNWTEAGEYCKAVGGRLPTETEWEYAARAGTTGPLYGSLDAVAWYPGNSGGTTHSVGLKQPNAFGLYDMLGNVWEWTSDNYDAEHKVVRGGSWVDYTGYVRASVRGGVGPTGRPHRVPVRGGIPLSV